MDSLRTEIINNASALYFTFAIVFLTVLYYIVKTKGLPPGPIGLPYLGYWPFLNSATGHLQLQKLGQKYGSVFSFTATGRLFINLGSIKAAREALIQKSECFVGRLEDNSLLFNHLEGGFVFLNGEPLKVMKKFFLQQFRERGMTTMKETLSGPIYDTINETVEELKKNNGVPIDIASILLIRCIRTFRLTLFGEDGMTDDEMKEFVEAYVKSLNVLTTTNLLPSGFISRLILRYSKSMHEANKGISVMKKILYKALHRRKETFDEHHIRDVFDAYYKEKLDRESKNDPTAKYFTDESLVVSLTQIVGDGTYFVALYIAGYFKTLLDHPEEQEKIYQELCSVVGMDRNPTIEDKSKLPYTNAFISESTRYSDIITTFPSLTCIKTTTVAGYKIPKGAVLFYNFWMAHMNPNDFEEPEKFNPSRYIMKDGNKRPELPMIFGLGKRSCIGEGYTSIQLFLYLTTIVKHFQLTKPENESKQSSLYYVSNKVNVCIQPRNQI